MATLRAGLIGANIQRTRLPRALETCCELTGNSLTFELIDTQGRGGFDFTAKVRELAAQGWTGVSVTHPWKTGAAAFAAEMVGAPARLGASNLLLFEADRVSARNTDYSGFLGAWKSRRDNAKPGRVAMAGAGGVARALAVALVELGAQDLALWDLDPASAIALAETVGAPARAVATEEAAAAVRAADGLVNATPLGMTPYPGMAFAAEDIGGQAWAFDAVYTPIETDFLRLAARQDLAVISGFDLFVHMAVDTFAAYSGIALDSETAVERLRPLAEGL